MQINITLAGNEGPHELNALAALIASLGGRAPTTVENNVTTSFTVGDRVISNPENPQTAGVGKMREPGDDEGPARNTDTSELDADIVDAAVAAGAPAFDSAGVPWDARIHSESRATIADGTWRKRRNVPQDVYDSVLAELTAAHPTAPAAPSEDVPPPPAATTNDTPEPPAPPAVGTAPVADVAAPAADVPPPPTGPDLSTFAKFVQSVMDKDVPTESKTYAALGKLCSESFDVPALKDMKDKPGSWALFYDMVG